jgi:hypothetical protein
MTDNYERSTAERLLDAGSQADWITPSYAIVRNALQDGVNVNVSADVWQEVKPQLQARGIPCWAEQLWYDGSAYWVCVSLAADDISALNAMLGDYGHQEAKDPGRLWPWLALVLLVLLALGTLALAAAVGGAL